MTLTVNVSDILGIVDNDKYPYRDYGHYVDKYTSKYNNPNNKDDRDISYDFRTIQDVFKDNNKNFERFIKRQITKDKSAVKIVKMIKKKYPECKGGRYDKYILKRIQVHKGKHSELTTINNIIEHYKLKQIATEKEIKLNKNNIRLSGRIDLLAENKKGKTVLIEVKHRMNNFKPISPYEISQIRFYMYMLNLKFGYIIEILPNGDMRKNKFFMDQSAITYIHFAFNELSKFYQLITGNVKYVPHSMDMIHPTQKNNFNLVLEQLYDIWKYAEGLYEVYEFIEYFNGFLYLTHT